MTQRISHRLQHFISLDPCSWCCCFLTSNAGSNNLGGLFYIIFSLPQSFSLSLFPSLRFIVKWKIYWFSRIIRAKGFSLDFSVRWEICVSIKVSAATMIKTQTLYPAVVKSARRKSQVATWDGKFLVENGKIPSSCSFAEPNNRKSEAEKLYHHRSGECFSLHVPFFMEKSPRL